MKGSCKVNAVKRTSPMAVSLPSAIVVGQEGAISGKEPRGQRGGRSCEPIACQARRSSMLLPGWASPMIW